VDAGEPSGSAGAPILGAIDATSLKDTAVIVSRYFGGTKLGVGGLVRAYGSAAAEAISAAPRIAAEPAVRFQIGYAFEYTSPVMRALERFACVEVQHGFSATGSPVLTAVTAAGSLGSLREQLVEQTAGHATFDLLGETWILTRV
jgi:putative IMPACT (imprinted ancient) family translation regulator